MAVLLLVLVFTPAFADTVSVRLEGVDGELETNVRAHLSLLNQGTDNLTPTQIRYLHRRAEEEIHRALEPFGYYAPAVSAELEQTEDTWVARYRIDPGKQITITTLSIEVVGDGQTDPTFKTLLSDPGLRVGDPLHHPSYERLKQRLQNLAASRGYYDAHWETQQIQIDRSQYQASVQLRYHTGQRYRYGAFSFSDTPLDRAFIDRFIEIEPGQPVLNSELLALQYRLSNTDYFQRVEVQPLWDQRADQQVPIEVVLDMRERTRYRTGIGYDTDTRARILGGITRRWVNAAGHGFDTQVQVGQVRSDAVMQYRIPGRSPAVENYTLRTAYERELSDQVDSRTLSTGASWQQLLGDWIQIIGADWEQEVFTVDQQKQRSRFIFPRISWSRTKANNRLDVANGYRINFELLGASDNFYSDTTFTQGRVELKGIYSPTSRFRLIGRTEVGATLIDDPSALPASKRFYAGGDNSVRGYSYKSLAPTSPTGDVEGGQGLITASTEIDYRFAEKWRAALFADHGAAINSAEDALSSGAGFGIRWLSPVGPLRFDIAWALDLDGSPWRIHFAIGPEL